MGKYTHMEKSATLQYADLYKTLSSPAVRTVGCYLLGDTVGEGTYGKVKRAVHQLTGREVAVKIVDKIHAPTVIREIDTLRNLRHPHIAQIYEVLTTETKIYIVTELARGGEAFDYVTNEGKLEESLAKNWFAQLVSAIGYCHKHDFVHRDLKLENILLSSHAAQNIKLIDFGFTTRISGGNMLKEAFEDYKLLDREIKQKKLLATCCGSVAYAAPEMLRGEKYSGEQSDIWSLGVILFTLVCGYLPFDDDSERVVLQKILKLEFSIPAFLSLEAKDLIASLLKLDPNERLTMDEIATHPWFTQSAGRVDVPQDYMASLLGPLRRNGLDAIGWTEVQSPCLGIHPTVHESSYESPFVSETADIDGESGRAILSALSDAGLDVFAIVESIKTNTCNQGSALYRLLQKNKLDEERNRPALRRRLSKGKVSDCSLPSPPPSSNEGHRRHMSHSTTHTSSISPFDLSMGFSKKRDLTAPTVSCPGPASQPQIPARRRRYSMPAARPPPWTDTPGNFAKSLEIDKMKPTDRISSVAEPVTGRTALNQSSSELDTISEPCPLLSPAPVRSRHATPSRHIEPVLVDLSHTAPEPTVRTPVPFRNARPPPTAAQRRIVRRRKNDRKGRMTISEESEDALTGCETAEIMEDLSRMACVLDGNEGDASSGDENELSDLRGWPRKTDVQGVCEMVWEEEDEESLETAVGRPESGSTLRRHDQFWRS